MNVRMIVGGLLILLGGAGILLGVVGWNDKQDVVDTDIIDVTVTERETSPLLAALGGIALVTGLVTLFAGRDRTPV
jgi:hypothetical protein